MLKKLLVRIGVFDLKCGGRMAGTKEQQQSLFNAENHQSPPQQEQLGLGFQKPTSTNPHDPTLHLLPAGYHADEHQNLAFDEEEKVCTLVLAPALDEERERKQAVDEENHQQLVKKEEALVNEALQLESSNQAIDGEKVSYNALSDELRDRSSIEFIDEAPEKSHDTKNGGANDEEIDRKEYDKAKSEWEPEICPVLDENEAENKELKGGSTDKHGSEFENEEGNDTIKVEEEKEQGTIDYYENNCSRTENGENNVRRFEGKEEQGIFGNYEDETSENEQVDESNGYGNVEGDCVGLKDEKYRRYHYPLRPDAEDCSYYMKTGTCKFGSNCKFNHPHRRKNQTAKETFKQKEENSDMLGETECKYYLTSGGCKYGKACRYNHSRGKTVVAPILEFNFLGLPIRPEEKECPYYMRNGSCKYGSNCRFNHPDPTAVGGGDQLSGFGDSSAQDGSKDAISGWASARTSDKTAPFVPVKYPPTPGAPPNPEWKGYQAPAYPTSEWSLPTPAFAMNIPERSLPTPPAFAMNIPERSLPTPPAFAMNIPATDANFYTHHQQQILVEEFPERPGQPECSYFMKTGDCKYRSGCKFHHSKIRIPKTSSFAFSDQGLPLRPDQNICTHYSRYGICKFGPACKYDHPLTYGNSASSAGSGPGQPPQYGNSANEDRGWKLDSLVQ